MPLPLIPVVLWGAGAVAGLFGAAQLDAHGNNGRAMRWLMRPFQVIGEEQANIGNEVGAHSMYETLDQIGEFLTGILGRNGFTDGIRNFAQKMQGIEPENRTFGTEGQEVTGEENMSTAALNLGDTGFSRASIGPDFNNAVPGLGGSQGAPRQGVTPDAAPSPATP